VYQNILSSSLLIDYLDIYIIYTNSSSIVTIFFNSILRNLQVLSLYAWRQMGTYELHLSNCLKIKETRILHQQTNSMRLWTLSLNVIATRSYVLNDWLAHLSFLCNNFGFNRIIIY